MPKIVLNKNFYDTCDSFNDGYYLFLTFYSNISLEEFYQNLIITSQMINEHLIISRDSHDIILYISFEELGLLDNIKFKNNCFNNPKYFYDDYDRTYIIEMSEQLKKVIEDWREFLEINFINKKVLFCITGVNDIVMDIIEYQEGQTIYFVSAIIEYQNKEKKYEKNKMKNKMEISYEQTQYLVI